jgi:hypothetical protein
VRHSTQDCEAIAECPFGVRFFSEEWRRQGLERWRLLLPLILLCRIRLFAFLLQLLPPRRSLLLLLLLLQLLRLVPALLFLLLLWLRRLILTLLLLRLLRFLWLTLALVRFRLCIEHGLAEESGVIPCLAPSRAVYPPSRTSPGSATWSTARPE